LISLFARSITTGVGVFGEQAKKDNAELQECFVFSDAHSDGGSIKE